MRLLRLSGRKVCERVKQKGSLWKGKHMQARVLPGRPRTQPQTAQSGIYTGILTSTKLHKSAVKRNRMRRRCREALRITLLNIDQKSGQWSVVSGQKLSTFHFPLSTSFQLLLLPRSSSLSAPFDELLVDAQHIITSLSRSHG